MCIRDRSQPTQPLWYEELHCLFHAWEPAVHCYCVFSNCLLLLLGHKFYTVFCAQVILKTSNCSSVVSNRFTSYFFSEEYWPMEYRWCWWPNVRRRYPPASHGILQRSYLLLFSYIIDTSTSGAAQVPLIFLILDNLSLMCAITRKWSQSMLVLW